MTNLDCLECQKHDYCEHTSMFSAKKMGCPLGWLMTNSMTLNLENVVRSIGDRRER